MANRNLYRKETRKGKEKAPDSSNPPPRSEDNIKNEAKVKYLESLALDLDLISPDTPALSEEDRQDLAMFDQLTRAQTQIMQTMGVESEVVEQETWNHDVAQQLIRLARCIKNIPFGTSSELFDLRPTEPAEEFKTPRNSASKKGKEKERKPEERRRSVFNLLPSSTEDTWLGDVVDPLPSMAIPDFSRPFRILIPFLFPDLFGENAKHQCEYRAMLYDTMKHNIQAMSTKSLEGNFLSLICIHLINILSA